MKSLSAFSLLLFMHVGGAELVSAGYTLMGMEEGIGEGGIRVTFWSMWKVMLSKAPVGVLMALFVERVALGGVDTLSDDPDGKSSANLTVRGADSSSASAELFSASVDLFSVTRQDFLLVFFPDADGLFSLAFKKAFLAEFRIARVDKEWSLALSLAPANDLFSCSAGTEELCLK